MNQTPKRLPPRPAGQVTYAGKPALVAALREQRPEAFAVLFAQYAPYVERLLLRTLGFDPEIPDIVQDVFVTAMRKVGRLREPEALAEWLGGVTVFTARGVLRSRRRKRWLRFFAPEDVPADVPEIVDTESREALREVYAILDRLPVDDRLLFTLRFIDGKELTDVARLTQVSLATVKRRLKRAQERFDLEARDNAALRGWVSRRDARETT